MKLPAGSFATVLRAKRGVQTLKEVIKSKRRYGSVLLL
ncbi:hypothetical protein SBF1_2050011 [Candidatus Desulfosporosinus infrequens]|uniref:Uncharacterized protein n=1 Tax=Candidatus Desulfosporosinus infrequens TaxID=2043169 RepID=A0A2U3KIA5_9FIRM|nr:hypothetical protein SBF1_2050011 [Candidatus Desulfosporosinus infrequens]